MSDCLTVEELYTCELKRTPVCLHENYPPSYAASVAALQPPLEVVTVSVDGYAVWRVDLVSCITRGTAYIFVDKLGRGLVSGLAVLKFYGEGPTAGPQSSEAHCTCVSPKPVLLLFNTICDNCGKEIK